MRIKRAHCGCLEITHKLLGLAEWVGAYLVAQTMAQGQAAGAVGGQRGRNLYIAFRCVGDQIAQAGIV